MRVVLLAPPFPPEMIQYTRGLKEVGAEVYGVADTPKEALSPELKSYMSGYLQVPRIMDEDDVIARVSAWLGGLTHKMATPCSAHGSRLVAPRIAFHRK